jgi:glycosyltransferase involved in cell wall biosynthesis
MMIMPNDNMQPNMVSVLMPCFNAEQTVDEAVESLLAQTFRNLEIVAVDDGSTDATAAKLLAWADKDERLQLVRQKNSGIIVALNRGLDHCRGEFVARMDADDRCHPDRFQAQVDFLDQHPDIDLVSCLVEGFPSDVMREGFRIYIEWLNGLTTPDEIAREIFIESPLVHPSILARRRVVERAGGYQDRGWAEDYDLWLRMHLAGARFAKVEQTLFYWREHPHRLTRTDSRYSVENFLRAKAFYLIQGPLKDRDAVILWGAGQMGRRISKHLQRNGAPLVAFVDIDPEKIGRQKRGCPVIGVEALAEWLKRYKRPVVLAAVGSRGARQLIRDQLEAMGLREGSDWWAVA